MNFAILFWVQLNAASITKVELHAADLSKAGLKNAVLQGAKLAWADLTGADLDNANLRGTDLRRTIFEPITLPLIDTIADAQNLHLMQFQNLPRALVSLRKAFKDAGFRKQEREITYAIKHTERQCAVIRQRFLTARRERWTKKPSNTARRNTKGRLFVLYSSSSL